MFYLSWRVDNVSFGVHWRLFTATPVNGANWRPLVNELQQWPERSYDLCKSRVFTCDQQICRFALGHKSLLPTMTRRAAAIFFFLDQLDRNGATIQWQA